MVSFRNIMTLPVLCSAIVGCAEYGNPPIDLVKSPAKRDSDASAYTGANMSHDTLMAFWTIDYGYRLNPEDDLDTIITPEFENSDALRRFDQFFTNENLARIVGKKIYCNCVGERYERDGRIYYKIREAQIFAK